ncbi:neuronal acetylcholine receptor subunit alpha-10-like [Ruditapes philippinarum]|uniref:neuronal acetylcholine receptor subunit alpha-10-like n=1 Tax=Ruditapes philippinarum TaxID=129788 RepID=UPI00295B3BDE|nr:neuronal acetylcholine receptor subunit alpha-10-like [Ruditapes philippinarum]
MDVSRFPFDEQHCILKFASWTYHGFQVNLSVMTDSVDLSDFIPSSEWELMESKVQLNRLFYRCCDTPFLDVTARLVILRAPTFYFYTMIIPCLWLTILNLLVFLLPAESGDKISLGVTVFLSFSVFMLVISEKVPVAGTIPLLAFYLTVCMGMTSITIFMTVFILNLHHAGPHRKGVPRWLRILTYNVLSLVLCLKPKKGTFLCQCAKKAYEQNGDNSADDTESNYDISIVAGKQNDADECKQKIAEEWKFVAAVLDRFFFWLFLSGNVLYWTEFSEIQNMWK